MCLFKLFTSGTEVASSYANLSEQEKESTSEKSSSSQDRLGSLTWPPSYCFGTPIRPK